MHDNISPEERLLRLIRRGGKRSSEKKEEKVAESREASRPKRITPKIFSLKTFSVTFSFELVNRILLVSLLIFGVYLLFDFLIVSPKRIEERISSFAQEEDEALEVSKETLAAPSVEPISYYTQAVKRRNLFAAQTAPMKQAPTTVFMEKVSKLRLQGIVSGDNPQAIIEDTESRRVYFISPGERIGQIELKEILPGKVRLIYLGQEMELGL